MNDIAGMHQPYEAPLSPEVHVKTAEHSIEECADMIMAKLRDLGYLQVAVQEAAE